MTTPITLAEMLKTQLSFIKCNALKSESGNCSCSKDFGLLKSCAGRPDLSCQAAIAKYCKSCNQNLVEDSCDTRKARKTVTFGNGEAGCVEVLVAGKPERVSIASRMVGHIKDEIHEHSMSLFNLGFTKEARELESCQVKLTATATGLYKVMEALTFLSSNDKEDPKKDTRTIDMFDRGQIFKDAQALVVELNAINKNSRKAKETANV